MTVSTQFFKFVLVGGFAAAVNFGSRIAYSLVFSFSTSIVLAYLSGMVIAYLLNRHLVFAPTGKPIAKEIIWFSLVNAAAVIQTLVVSLYVYSYIFPDVIGTYAKEFSHFLGVMVPVFTSYLGHRLLTFRKEDSHD